MVNNTIGEAGAIAAAIKKRGINATGDQSTGVTYKDPRRNSMNYPNSNPYRRESDIVGSIRRYLKTLPQCFFWKEHGGKYGTAGIPDIICCLKGHFFGFEVKTQKGRTTKLQDVMIRKINDAGGTAAVVRSVADVKSVIARYEESVEPGNS